MRKIAQSMVFLKIRNKYAFRDPILSVDYDLETLNAVIDAFITIMYRNIMKINASNQVNS